MRTTIRRAVAAGAVVATAAAATVAVGLGAFAAQTSGAPAAVPATAPRPAAAESVVESGTDIAQGGLYRVVSERYEVLDLDRSEASDGTRIQTWERNDSPAQTWRLWDGGEGSYLVETTVSKGGDKVVDADTGDGTVGLWTMNGSNGEANQRWSFEPVGGGWFHVRNSAAGCLTAGTAEGDQVTVKDCGDDLAQLWCLESAEPPSGPTAEKGIRGEAARRIEAEQPAALRALAADDPALNTDYLIVDAKRAQASGHAGVSVHWIGPAMRNPYDTWDWVEIVDGSSRTAWNWVCPQTSKDCDGANGETLIDSDKLQNGKKYVIRYWSDGGRVSKGTLRASAEFVA